MREVDTEIRSNSLHEVTIPLAHHRRKVLVQSAFVVVLAFCGMLRRSTARAIRREDLSPYEPLPHTLRVHLTKEKGRTRTRVIAIRGPVGQWLIKHLSYLNSSNVIKNFF